MERLTLARWGLWVFTAGIFAWIFPNLGFGAVVNALTDVAIVVFGILAAAGLPRAVDGIGLGPLKTGLVGIATLQFLQNVNSAVTGLGAVNAAPVAVILLASVAVGIGAFRWREDGWDLAALPWLCGGFAGFAFEPLYYTARQLFVDGVNGYTPGGVLVLVGAVLSAMAFRPGGDVGPAED